MNELVKRLADGLHPIVAERSASARELQEQIERGFVLLKFPNTRGGTELRSQLAMEQTKLDGADFEAGTGNVRLVGNLTLNYDKVQLVADIDLASLKGTGHLVVIEEAASAASANDQSTGDDDAASDAAGETQQAGEAAEAKMKAGPKKKKANAPKAAEAE